MTNHRLFRTVCPECEKRAIAKAAGTEGFNVLVVGCEHNLMAATLIVDGGLIINWSAWPAPDVESFSRGATQQAAVLQGMLTSGDEPKH